MAYIDHHCQQAQEVEQEMLKEACQLVLNIWNIGSKGKRTKTRYNEAQVLVVDTFHLVNLLDGVTELVPVSTPD